MELSKNSILIASDGDTTCVVLNGVPISAEAIEFKAEYSSLHHYTVNQIGVALDKLGIMVERPRIDGKQTKVRRLPCHKWGRMEIPVTTQKTDALLN